MPAVQCVTIEQDNQLVADILFAITCAYIKSGVRTKEWDWSYVRLNPKERFF